MPAKRPDSDHEALRRRTDAEALRMAHSAPWAFATLVLFHVADLGKEWLYRCG